MADPLLRVGRSRGFNSLIKGKTLDDIMRKALKKDLEPVVQKKYDAEVGDWTTKPKFDVNISVGPRRGQVMTVTPKGNKLAVERWLMVDKKGRTKEVTLESKKFKIVKRKTKVKKTKSRNVQGAHFGATEKGGTYKRLIPMPFPFYSRKTTGGDGSYKEFTGASRGNPQRDEVIFRTKATLGIVKPLYITRDKLAPEIRKEMTRVVENAYRRAFRAITGRGI